MRLITAALLILSKLPRLLLGSYCTQRVFIPRSLKSSRREGETSALVDLARQEFQFDCLFTFYGLYLDLILQWECDALCPAGTTLNPFTSPDLGCGYSLYLDLILRDQCDTLFASGTTLTLLTSPDLRRCDAERWRD